jgi:subtilisin family serine protease
VFPRARWLCLFLAVFAGCGGDDGGPPASSDDPRRNILLVDDGIDPSAPALAGRVVGLYTITCAPPPAPADAAADGDAGLDGDGGTDGDAGATRTDAAREWTLEEVKTAWLGGLRRKDESCHLRAGIDPKPDPLARVARHREAWNRAIRGDRYPGEVMAKEHVDEMVQALTQDLATARTHGTATAGVIAHENAQVRLVLVETQLADPTRALEEYTCVRQSDLERSVSLLADPEIRQAYVDSPTSTLTDELRALRVQHRVGVVNESFGRRARESLEMLQEMKGCPSVDMAAYFAALGPLNAAWSERHADPEVLVVKAAGNESLRLESPTDAIECAPAPSPRLSVGSYDLDGVISEFSNTGACVDVFAPGNDIIVPLPGDWYIPWSGTSFAAPLIARLVSRDGRAPFTPIGARQSILDMRDSSARVHITLFPASIRFDPEQRSTRFRLTSRARRALPSPVFLPELRRHLRLLRPRPL